MIKKNITQEKNLWPQLTDKLFKLNGRINHAVSNILLHLKAGVRWFVFSYFQKGPKRTFGFGPKIFSLNKCRPILVQGLLPDIQINFHNNII